MVSDETEAREPGGNGAATSDPAAAPLLAIAILLASLALLALAVLAIDSLREALDAALHGDSAGVRDAVDELGVGGPLIVLGLCLAHTVIWYPAEIVDAAAGFVFGFWPAFALVMFGWLLNGFAAYAIGHSLAHPLLRRLLGQDRFDRAEAMVSRGGVTLLLAVRLVPIFPFSVISYAAGAARVPLWRFTWTTMVGYTPITALSVYLGTQLEDLHLTHPLVIGGLILLIVLLFAIRWISPSTAVVEGSKSD